MTGQRPLISSQNSGSTPSESVSCPQICAERPSMKIPIIRGLIDRRILVNYHVDPGVLTSILPSPFRPKIVHGAGMVGICLIRLKGVRPAYLPPWLGLSSENAAHRIAVEWVENGTVREGVYVRRRDTNSRLNSLVGGRLFPGIHHHATFDVRESRDRFDIAVRSDDRTTCISVAARRATGLSASSVFGSLAQASAFFQAGTLGYSATSDASRFQGLELRCLNWHVEPLEVEAVQSSFFDDRSFFPKGSIELDSALLMQGIEHEWHGRSGLCCSPCRSVTASNP